MPNFIVPQLLSRMSTPSATFRRPTQCDVEMHAQATDQPVAELMNLIPVLFGRELSALPIQAYFDLLRTQIVASRGVLYHLLILTGNSSDDSVVDALRLVRSVATVVRDDKNPSRSIHSVATALLRRHDVDISALDEQTRNACWEAILAILCWLTALTQPGSTSYRTLTSHIKQGARRPFTSFLRSSADLLPGLTRSDHPPPGMSSRRAFGERSSQIYVSSLNYGALSTFGKVKIRWTDSLSTHLSFHLSSRTLHLFRFPSLCVLSLPMGTCTPLLQILLQSYCENDEDAAQVNQYLREVIMSYRVLFGQSRPSRKIFAKREKPLAGTDALLHMLCGQARVSPVPGLPVPSSCLGPDDTCQKGWMGELTEQGVYDASLDFPVLGDRLLALQAFNTRQQSSRIRDLWRDRRDPIQWYTFWLVLILGGLSLLLSILQSGLAAAQLYYQIHAPR